MRLSELIEAQRVLLPFEAPSPWVAIENLVEHLSSIGVVKAEDVPVVTDAVLRREKSRSTGMEHGIAVPHAISDRVERIEAVLGLSEEGVTFGSIDGQRARILILVVVPHNLIQKHVRTLAGIARLLNDGGLREALLTAETPEQVCDCLCADDVVG